MITPAGKRAASYTRTLFAAGYTPDRALPDVAELAGIVHDATVRLVRQARKAGRSWEFIGQHLGMSKQAAWEKYARHVEPEPEPERLPLQ